MFTVGIAVATAAKGAGRCLLFSIQTSSQWDDQDVAHAEDTYCITDEVQSTTYCGVSRQLLTPQELRLKFTAEVAQKLAVNPTGRFPLRVDEASVEQLRSGLRRVLTGGRNGRAVPSELVV